MTPEVTMPDDELLQSLVVGDIDEHDPAVVARLAKQPELAVRWRELQATLDDVQLLRDVGEVLREPDAASPDFDPREAVRSFRAGQTAGPRRRWWQVSLAAAAAAAVLLLAWQLGWFGGQRDRHLADPHLGGTKIVLSPDGVATADRVPFTWTAPASSAYYRLEIEALDQPTSPQTFALDHPVWQPTPEQRRALPQHFRWRVVCYDASREILATSGWASSSRP